MKGAQPSGLNTGSLISSGGVVAQRFGDTIKKEPVGEDWNRSLIIAFHRLGAFSGVDQLGKLVKRREGADLKIEGHLDIKGLSLKDALLNDRKCKLLEYLVEDTCGSVKKDWTCSLWLDIETGLPLRRKSSDARGTWTEDYTSLETNAKVDDAGFLIPED